MTEGKINRIADDQDLDNALLEVTRILLPHKVHKLETLNQQQQSLPTAERSADILPFRKAE